jgi:arsenate reductase (thioredoxin)
MTGRRKVLFVCGRNAARSQMAEALLNALSGDRYEASSAGLKPSTVSRIAIRVMAEAGIDISAHRSKSVGELAGERFDILVTLCDEAACAPASALPRAESYLHRTFPDPAAFRGDEEVVLEAYRDLRDRMAAWIRGEFGQYDTPRETDPGPPGPASPQSVKGETANLY